MSCAARGCRGRRFSFRETLAVCKRPRAETRAKAGCQLVGVGSSAPASVLTNDDLSEFIDTSDEWISTRTGIRQRHVLAAGECLTDHAVSSTQKALKMAGIEGSDVDMVILCTSSADDAFGSATQVQHAIGATKAIAFDLTAACSGFVLGVVTAAQFIRAGTRKRIVVIGADALSRYLDWTDRSSCILFGDGAGAVVMTAHEGACGLLGCDMASNGAGYCDLNAPFDTASNGKALAPEERAREPRFSNLHMNGSEVFKFAVRVVPRTLQASLDSAGMTEADVDWLVMHQANQRILDAAAKKLSLPPDRVVSNLAEFGNTSAASIPLALDAVVQRGAIARGDTIALAGFGAGLTWASAIVRWH